MSLSIEEKRQIEEMLLKALEADAPEKRRVAAEALLKYRLNSSFLGMENGGEIDLSYVTCAEYQLFLDDMRAQGEFYQPDHWTHYQFPKGKAKDIVSGIRPEDAVAFCKWLERYENEGNRYRLPNPEEARTYKQSTENEILTWCRDSDLAEYKLVGIKNSEQTLNARIETVLTKSKPPLSVMDFNSYIEITESPGFFSNLFVNGLRPLMAVLAYVILTTSFFNASTAVFVTILGIYLILTYLMSDGDILDAITNSVVNIIKGMLLIMILAVALLYVYLVFLSCLGWTFLLILYVTNTTLPMSWIGQAIFGIDEALNDFSDWITGNIRYYVKKIFNFGASKQNDSSMSDGVSGGVPVSIPDSVPAIDVLTYRKLFTENHSVELTKMQRASILYYEKIFAYIKGNPTKQRKKQEFRDFQLLQVILARKDGSLPAWEGIRLVREIPRS